jgi:tight adherence protein B
MSLIPDLAIVFLIALLFAGFEMFAGEGKRRMRARSVALSGRATPPERGARLGGESDQAGRLKREAHTPFDVFLRQVLPRSAALSARLSASGSGLTIGRYAMISGGVATVAMVLTLLQGVGPVPSILLGLLVGLLGPHVAVGWLLKRRRNKFFKLFPDAIGLIVRGLKAGLPVGETLQVLGRDIADPLGEEFRRISDDVKLGRPIEDAMWTVARRLNLPEFNFLVITMSVQRETGGNLAETLENLADILRKRRQMRLKVKAMSSEATASAGIIGSLPFVMAGMMCIVSRAYIMSLFSSGLGLVMVAGGATSLLIGVFVMAKMVSFEL